MLKEGNQKMREKIKRKKAKEENKKPIRDTKNLQWCEKKLKKKTETMSQKKD